MMLRLLLAILPLALLCDAATAQDLYAGAIRTYFDSETNVSGDEQDDTEQIPKASFVRTTAPETTYGDRNKELKALRFFERSDEPCAVSVVTALHMVGEQEHVWDACAGARRSQREIAWWFFNNVDEGQDAGFGQEHGYLTAIRVCHTEPDARRPGIVKGVEAEWTSHAVAPEGSEADTPRPWNRHYATDSFSRNNCKGNWQEWARCPFNTVALAVKLHHKPLDGRRALTGISLKCHRMRSQLFEAGTFERYYFDYHPVNNPDPREPPPYDEIDPERVKRKGRD